MTVAYPLQWPPGWPRTEPGRREASKFRTSLDPAVKQVLGEVSKIGGKSPVISTNYALGHPSPADPGAAVYFTYQGDQVCVPCDRWRTLEGNVRAIAATLESLRAIERWGAKHMVKAAFRGFAALPPPGGKHWREVLKVGPAATVKEVHDAFLRLAMERHPDKGGSPESMAELNAAREAAHRDLGA